MSLAAALQADGARPASFLPSVKCSSCGEEIEIASMGDHLCGKPPPSSSPKTHAAHVSNSFALRPTTPASQHQPVARSPLGQPDVAPQQSRGRAPTLGSIQQPLSPKPMRPPPPRINPDAANQPFLGPGPSRTDSPVSPALSSRSGRSQSKPYMPPFARGAVSPGPRLWDPRPPSPELSGNMDCAFPPFPTAATSTSAGNSRPGTSHGRKTPTPSERAPSRGSSRMPSRMEDREPFNLELRSPRGNGGESVMKKMDCLPSGPFDAKRRKPSEAETIRSDPASLQTDTPDLRSKTPEGIPPRPSTSASNHSSHSRRASEKRTPPARPARPDDDVSSPSFLEHFSSEPVPDLPSTFSPSQLPAGLREEERSNTYPIELQNPSSTRDRRPSEPTVQSSSGPRPTVTKTPTSPPNLFPPRSESRNGQRMDFRLQGAPPVPKPVEQARQDSLHTPSESGSSTMSSIGQSGSSVGPSPSSSTASSVDAFSPLTQDSSVYIEERNLPPIPSNIRNNQRPGDRAAEKLGSPPRNLARPSPPRQDPPVLAQPLPKPNPRFDRPMDSPTDPSIQSRSQNVQEQRRPSQPGPNAPGLRAPPRPGLLRTQTAPLSPTQDRAFPRSPAAAEFSPDEFDPYKQQLPSTQYRPRAKSSASQASGATSPSKLQNHRPPVPTISTPTPPPIPAIGLRGPSPGRKGTVLKPPCRGCGKIIEGKSVKAADGRLTGRWHKTCFTCRTCHEPFATADFYVIENHPYCEQHYHEKNGSLCYGCHRGIEGQYLETNGSSNIAATGGHERKYHPRCFTCHDCRQVLSDDYFEILGKVYCERHALAAMRGQARVAGANGASAAGNAPGPLSGLNPAMSDHLKAERRTTKLMMM